MPSPKFTTEILSAAITGFQQQKAQIDAQIAELRAMMAGAPASAPASIAQAKKPAGRKKMSAAARKRIGKAMRQKWLEKKAAQPSEPVVAVQPKKRKLSAAGLKSIVEANKKRWALKKAEAANNASGKVAKKTALKKAPSAA